MIINTDLLEHEDIKKLSKLEDTLREVLGDTGLLEEIFRAMSYREEKDMLEFIARMHDVDVEEDK